MTKKQVAMHWADSTVNKVIAQKGNKKTYVLAAGITPSGTVHIGNFREIITVDLVARAFIDAGKKVRFIYSWDDYDVFRKVPSNLPGQEDLQKLLRKAIVDIPDPYSKVESYAKHFENQVERDVAIVGINPEYLYQAKKYRAGEYAKNIIVALQNTQKIKDVLNKYRKEPLANDWLPLSGYCPACGTDDVTFCDYDNKQTITINCKTCNYQEKIDILTTSILKLPWRIDWPMRWAYEKVDFEPGGKDHSTQGSSYTTGQEIVKIYDWTAPTYTMYDFVRVKGVGGKISSSTGNVITLAECLEVYEPAIVRWLFAGTRPNAEFAISFDVDVIKIYEDFDKCERIYYKAEDASEKETLKQKRIYELSCVEAPSKKIPFQPSFRHLSTVVQIYSFNNEKIIDHYSEHLADDNDKKRLLNRAECVERWLEKHAPDDYKFRVQDKAPTDLKLDTKTKTALKQAAQTLQEKTWTDKELHEEFYKIIKNNNLEVKDFFKAAYNTLIAKDKGPQLANFVLIIGQEKVAKLFDSL